MKRLVVKLFGCWVVALSRCTPRSEETTLRNIRRRSDEDPTLGARIPEPSIQRTRCPFRTSSSAILCLLVGLSFPALHALAMMKKSMERRYRMQDGEEKRRLWKWTPLTPTLSRKGRGGLFTSYFPSPLVGEGQGEGAFPSPLVGEGQGEGCSYLLPSSQSTTTGLLTALSINKRVASIIALVSAS